MKSRLKKIVLGLIILLALTNPSQTDFNNMFSKVGGHRTLYFLLFSVYEYNQSTVDCRFNSDKTKVYCYTKKYIGIFKNFIPFYTKETREATPGWETTEPINSN